MNFSSLKSNLFIILLVVISAVFIWVIRPYIGSIFWAAVLASIFYPVQKFWMRVSKDRKSTSALLSLLTIFFIVLMPLYFLGNAVVKESISLYQRLSASESSVVQTIGKSDVYEKVMQSLEQYGINKEEVRGRVASSARTVSQYLFSRAAEFGQNTLVFLAEFLIMFYLLYFFLRDGDALLQRLQYLLPLGNRKEQRLYDKFASTSRATLKGTLIIAIVQGTLGGLLFWVVGINSPVLWGALMTALSIIPAVGSALIWLPAGLILLFTGHIWQGVTTLIVGTAVIGLIDNVLRPPLVGKDTELPQAMILLSTLGGLSVFGISGFVIGPIIAAFFLAVWQMFEEEYRSELTERG